MMPRLKIVYKDGRIEYKIIDMREFKRHKSGKIKMIMIDEIKKGE